MHCTIAYMIWVGWHMVGMPAFQNHLNHVSLHSRSSSLSPLSLRSGCCGEVTARSCYARARSGGAGTGFEASGTTRLVPALGSYGPRQSCRRRWASGGSRSGVGGPRSDGGGSQGGGRATTAYGASCGGRTRAVVSGATRGGRAHPRPAGLRAVWQNHLNYPGSSALAITIKATSTQTHFKRNNSWSVG